jgi:hypothetical protein
MTRWRSGPARGSRPRNPASELTWARGDGESGTTYYLLGDEAGPLAQFIPPGLVAALERSAPAGTPAWVPMRFMGQAALTLASEDGDAGALEETVFVAFGPAAWRALAGRDVPALADGPLQLTFPRMPDRLPLH